MGEYGEGEFNEKIKEIETKLNQISRNENSGRINDFGPLEEIEDLHEEVESGFEPRDESKSIEFENYYEPLNESEKKKPSKEEYPTMDFIEDIRDEISKLVPSHELHGGRISYDKLSEYLDMHTRYIRDTRNRIVNSNNKKYNPDFKFSNEQLNNFISSFSKKFSNVDISSIEKLVNKYVNSNDLIEYRQQQWHLHNPDLKYDYFKSLDSTSKGYYFGLLLAEGTISSKGNLGIFLEKEDINVMKRYRKELNIVNKLEYVTDKRKKKQSGEYPERYGVRVGCKPMINDLKNLGFLNFKERNALKEGFFTNMREDVALSILLGFYDGDGEESAPIIHSTNKKFLKQIKREFNIKHEIKLKRKAERTKVWTKECDIKDQWYLRIGPELFNRMMESYDYSMERKRAYYPMKGGKYAYDALSKKIGNRECLNELSLIGPRTKLADAFGCSFELFKRLCDEYNIKTLPHSYWKRADKKDWKLNFDKKIEDFKNKYLVNNP
ncbi:MAG: hypothetical protein ACFFB0_17505 [Promethearchaeota archaeon]